MSDDSNSAPRDSDSIKRDLVALETVLRRTRVGYETPAVFEGVRWLITTIAAVALTALGAGLLIESHGPAVFRWILLGGSSSALLVAIYLLFKFRREEDPTMSVARHLQHWVPELRNDLTSALQFGRELVDESTKTYSRELAAEHLRVTTRKALGMVDGKGSLAHLLPKRDTTPATVAMAGGLIAVLAVLYFAPPERLGALWGGVTSPDEEAPTRPVVGDLEVFIQQPAYTKLPSTMSPFTTGNIKAMVGSEITIKTYPLLEAKRFEMVQETEDGERVLPMERDGVLLKVSFLATKASTYQFRAVVDDDTTISDGMPRRIELLPDQKPSITITSHEGEVEVSPDEVLEIEFNVQDDFGIDSVVRVHGFEGEDPQKIGVEFPELAAVPRELDGKLAFDLAPLNLQPKDSVVFTIQASDNNTLTGPGVGVSAPLVLRVASPEDKHMRVIEAQQEVVEALLAVLGDFLESPVGERQPDAKGYYDQVVGDVSKVEMGERYQGVAKASSQLGETLKLMNEVVGRMEQDPLMLERDFALFRSVYEQLYELQRNGDATLLKYQSQANEGRLTKRQLSYIADYAAEAEDSLEKGILRLQDLLSTQRMDAVQATAKDIKELKDRLKELLERYKESKDPELKKAIMREIKRLRARMREMMQRMQSQLQELPQEHMNMDAVQAQQLESDAQQLSDEMQSIEQLLENDDIDGALEALERMTENLDSLTQDMDQQFASAQPEGLSELDQELSKLMDQVNDLEMAQRNVEEQTSELQKEIMEKHQERMKSMIDKMSKDALELVREQKKALNKLPTDKLPKHEQDSIADAKRRVENLEDMLAQRDLEQSMQLAKQSVEELKTLQFGVQLMERYVQRKSRAANAMKETMKSLDGSISRGEEIQRQIEGMMERAQQQMAGANQQQLQQLAKQQQQVSEQAGKLQQSIGEASGKFPMLQQQLSPGAEAAKQSMEGAQQSLEGRKIQRGLDGQRQALDELNKLKQSMRQSLQKERRGKQKNGRPTDTDKVEIPDKKQGSTKYRDEVMRNMKEGRLENYSDEIERYYKSLME